MSLQSLFVLWRQPRHEGCANLPSTLESRGVRASNGYDDGVLLLSVVNSRTGTPKYRVVVAADDDGTAVAVDVETEAWCG